jgi:uncharacterized iron-regulated membrane protein
MNIFLLAHVSEEHTANPATLTHHWTTIFALVLFSAAVLFGLYMLFKEKTVSEKEDTSE